jgi:hypothetical protein
MTEGGILLTEHPSDRRTSLRFAGVVTTGAILAGLYVAFVLHYGSVVPHLDDWATVALVSDVLSGHGSWGEMWMQHDVNRMFVPNLVFVGLGKLTHDDLRAVLVASALVLVCTFVMFLRLVRSYLARPLTIPVVLAVGLLWFSLADFGSALWAIQFAWYLVLLFFVAILYFLLVSPSSTLAFGAAFACAVAASFCYLEGLIVWPLGLICILWMEPWQPSRWGRPTQVRAFIWAAGALICVGAYFVGWQQRPAYPDNIFPKSVAGIAGSTFSLGFIVHHPGSALWFVLVATGNVFPTDGPAIWLRGLIGIVVVLASVYVLVSSLRNRRARGLTDCLPAAMILVTLIFDAILAVGRANFGIQFALLAQYSMYELLALIGILLYGWKWARSVLPATRSWLAVAAALIILLQVFASSIYGVAQAGASEPLLRTEARLVVTSDLVPPNERLCYYVTSLYEYVVPTIPTRLLDRFRQQQLSIFSSGPYRSYRSDGLPVLKGCDRSR